MKKGLTVVLLMLMGESLFANASLKKAFAAGIKTSMEVVKYEKSQALKPIPEGYCVAITGKETPLELWEEVKLESLAMFFELTPALLAPKSSTNSEDNILCLSISPDKKEAMKSLKKIAQKYPKIDEYITKVEILSSHAMHRVIPGVGAYFKDQSAEIAALKQNLKIDKPLSKRVIFLNHKKDPKSLFDNGSTRVVRSALPQVLYVEHTVYRKRGE